ncbi:MAG: AraC family transcriptional regulator [Treponema sp.]
MINSRKQESVQRGNAFFPIQYYMIDTSNPLYNLPLHWHLDFELIHIIEGNYAMFIGNCERTLHPGDICFITSGILHGDGKDVEKCLYESVVFDPDMLRLKNYSSDEFISKMIDRQIYADAVIPAAEENREFLSTAQKLYKVMKEKPEGYELFTTGFMFEFLGLVKEKNYYFEKSLTPSTGKKLRTDQLKAVLNLVQTRYNSALSLEQMADTAGLSPKYFCRVFREMTHHTPVEYLNLYRVNCACDKLRTTDDPIIDVAYGCGFNDFSYFIKIFKRYKGMTPFKYRNYDETKRKIDITKV